LTFIEVEILIVNDQDFPPLQVLYSLLKNTFQPHILKPDESCDFLIKASFRKVY